MKKWLILLGVLILMSLMTLSFVSAECGDGTCDGNETLESCSIDCASGNFQCIDFCGDGACQQDDCQGQAGCPCRETIESCQQDCLSIDEVNTSSLDSSGLGSYFWIGLSVLGALLFVFIGLKIFKWLFWALAFVMIALAVIFWFVL